MTIRRYLFNGAELDRLRGVRLIAATQSRANISYRLGGVEVVNRDGIMPTPRARIAASQLGIVIHVEGPTYGERVAREDAVIGILANEGMPGLVVQDTGHAFRGTDYRLETMTWEELSPTVSRCTATLELFHPIWREYNSPETGGALLTHDISLPMTSSNSSASGGGTLKIYDANYDLIDLGSASLPLNLVEVRVPPNVTYCFLQINGFYVEITLKHQSHTWVSVTNPMVAINNAEMVVKPYGKIMPQGQSYYYTASMNNAADSLDIRVERSWM